ncbi:MAG: pyridoxamine 5'-phosphate oxidase family protein [Boseongicola sp.]|nr:pyridoxamine 5'-phosphate oxidase family protein [Boseongicola sp.]
MGTRYAAFELAHRRFIETQHIFFTGTAAHDGRVNVSPKGMGQLRVLGPNRILWRNLTGSGNESAAHVAETGRMTLMWCAFEGPPMILRAYGTARAIHRLDADWADLDSHFDPDPAARQIFDLTVDLVQKSCGYGVPEVTYRQDRPVLTEWAANKGEDGIRAYWANRNARTIDDKPTDIVRLNIGTEQT